MAAVNAPQNAVLTLMQGNANILPRTIHLFPRNIRIGRSSDCDVVIKSKRISKQHVIIEMLDGRRYIRDTSNTGILLNGGKMVKNDLTQLWHNDIINFLANAKYIYTQEVSQPNRNIPLVDLSSERLAVVSISRNSVQRALSAAIPSTSSRNASKPNSASNDLRACSSPSFSPNEDSEPVWEVGNSSKRSAHQYPLRNKRGLHDTSVNTKKSKIETLTSIAKSQPQPVEPDSNFNASPPVLAEKNVDQCTDLAALRSALKACFEKERKTEGDRKIDREELLALRSDANIHALATKKETYNSILELVESEFNCSVCEEVFIGATVLSCGHAYCSFCIDKWLQRKPQCPICRSDFQTRTRHIKLDNFLSRFYESLQFPMDLKMKRKAAIEERKNEVQENENAQLLRAISSAN